MAFGSDRSANFVIAAKDAATQPLGRIGKAMGTLQRTGVTAFKAVGAAAIAAGAALVAFAANAVMAAAEDEKQTIRLNAALKARGFQMDQLSPKI
jgi:class 3 adenylate cyclase